MELLRRWLAGDYELVVYDKLLADLKRVLLRPKFRKYLSEAEATEYVDLFHRLATAVPDPPEIHGLTPDPGLKRQAALVGFDAYVPVLAGDILSLRCSALVGYGPSP